MDSDAAYWEMLLWHKNLHLSTQNNTEKSDKISNNHADLPYSDTNLENSRQEPLSDLSSGTFLFHLYVWRLGEIVPNNGLAVEIACTTIQSDNILSFTFV